MEVPAKVPDDAVNWRAVDIFVFTNGQQQSPPRKYHLSAQELNWWKDILRHLARSQYGSLSSTIDLYSVEGKKLEGPLELINGAAYVVVKPTDQFIDAGYNKYLIKASRSWEKGKVRRPSSIQVLKPAECSVLTSHSNVQISTSEKKKNEENLTCYANASANSNKVIEKPHTFLNGLENPNGGPSLAKYPIKKKLSLLQRDAILRKTNASAIRKDSIRSKDTPSKTSKATLKKNDTVEGSKIVEKLNITQKTVTPTVVPKSNPDYKENTETPHILNISEAAVVTDVAEVRKERVGEEALFVSNIKNDENEFLSKIVPIPHDHICDKIDNIKVLSNITEESDVNEPKGVTEVYRTQKHVKPVENDTLNLVKDLHKHETNMSQTQREPNVSFVDNSDKNYLVINNGDNVHLKLQVEVTNAECAINEKNKNLPKIPSPLGDRAEKGYQTNISSDISARNKSLQTIFLSDNVGFHGNSGVLVIKCACCQENTNNTSRVVSVNDSKIYVKLLRNPDPESNLERDQCREKTTSKIDKNDVPTKNSISYPVKKTDSITAIETLNNDADVLKKAVNEQNITKTQDVGSAKNFNENETPEDKNENRIIEMEHNEKDGSKSNIKTSETEANECTAMILANAKQYLDKSTQSELCSLLLEARHHEDGRYSFHLPPLDVLKNYKC